MTHDEEKESDEVEYGGIPSISALAQALTDGRYKNIMVLSGAGISCSAGIPDFRSPDCGLYHKVDKYNLPCPEAAFDLTYYHNNPAPFISLASEIWPKEEEHTPTLTHSFVSLLHQKGLLLRNYTQNIDMLESRAGVPQDKIVECHGSFRTASCIECYEEFDIEECRRLMIDEKEAPLCQTCFALVKPDIVFAGESLPFRFDRLLRDDLQHVDLLIVIGTSLSVEPVSQIPNMIPQSCPRVLLNKELVGDFDANVGRDFFMKGNCDDNVRELSKLMGLIQELEDLNKSTAQQS
eukprot:CAMPEP_0185731460 /NCGR_PEP_ID=MMETSP1171-20130828/12981_1 /TAXON_ID=374046 /ORGANISM="Helicotheca tamensis, Strain CCMP826" /LENGTH=292 /DNA_ID=CAMNT_0028400733 /DNA_START=187 /DNA_END=1065 /DNA_ORIENTATION=-